MLLSELVNANCIKVDVQSTDKEELFEELVDLLVTNYDLDEREEILDAVLAREEKQTTGIQEGIGIPHAKIPLSIDRKVIGVIGISKEGIEYDAMDGKPVHLIFLIIADEKEPGIHIKALQSIAMFIKIPGAYNKMLNSKSKEEAYKIISEEEAGKE